MLNEAELARIAAEIKAEISGKHFQVFSVTSCAEDVVEVLVDIVPPDIAEMVELRWSGRVRLVEGHVDVEWLQ